MTDLSENASDLTDNDAGNTGTQGHFTEADIDAINAAWAEAEDLENTCETLGENLETDEVAQSCDEVAAELQDEPVENTDRLEDEENNTHDSEKDALSDSANDDISENNTHEVSEENEAGTVAENTTIEESDEQVGNSEQLEPDFEIPEPEPYICPWADAPSDCYFFDKTYEDGHLGSFTESAETAYKFGWDIEHNYIPIADTEKSDVNGWTYRKELCPHKSERDKQIELWNREIFELKEELQRTDYKAIKYAEGVLTDEEYQPTGIQRQAWRKRINELERLIAG